MKKSQWLFFLLFAGVGCIFLLGLLLLYVNYASSQAVPTFPLVTITSTFPEGTGVVNQPVVVFGEASDTDGIASAELWINGRKIASQANTGQGQSPFEISQSWIPDGPGNYLFLLRGVDQKGFAGVSQPVMIQVGERSYQPDPTLYGQYIVQTGDTIDSLAAQFGTTPDEIRSLNPGLGDLTPGESLSVPPRPETAAGGITPVATPPPLGGVESPTPAGGGSDEPLHVSPPPAPSAAGGVPAAPASAPAWVGALPASFYCVASPAACAAPVGDAGPLPPASDVHASLTDACTVSVSWTDNSTGEAGFRIYRLVMRPHFRADVLELVASAPGSGTRLAYADTAVPASQFFYAIVTINERGEEVWSAPSEQIETTCPTAASPPGSSYDVEALDMTVADSSIDRLYCYVSLAGSPFERIPAGGSEFITLEAGTWNIATYASGDNKRTLRIDGTRPLEIVAECLGRQGDTLINLGRFTRSHPPEEWDGRMLTAGPDSGAFSVAYRIQPTPPTGHGGGAGDPSIPVPFNLHAVDSWTSCHRAAGDSILCGTSREPGLAWDYTVDPSAPQPPLYFKVYKLADGGGAPSLFYTTLDGTHMSAPRGNCERASYVVSAVVGIGPVTDPAHPRRPRAEIQSSVSAPLEIRPTTCGQLEITLVGLRSYYAPYHAYGNLVFNDVPVLWNLGPCPSDTLCGGAPSYTVVSTTAMNNWADMYLSVAGGSFGHPHNVFRVPVRDGEALRMSLQLFGVLDRVQWCGGLVHPVQILLPARSLAAWRIVDQDATYNIPFAGDACGLTLHVRGIP